MHYQCSTYRPYRNFLCLYERSINLESNLWSASFSKKTNRRICFVCFFALHGKQIKFLRSFFGRIYSSPICFWFYLTFSPLSCIEGIMEVIWNCCKYLWEIIEESSNFTENLLQNLNAITLGISLIWYLSSTWYNAEYNVIKIQCLATA